MNSILGKIVTGRTDCITSAWGPWSPCSGPCSSGSRKRTRTVLASPMFNGSSCGDLVERQSCISPSCTADNQINLLCQNAPLNSYQPIGQCPTKYVYCPAVGTARVLSCPFDQAFSVEKQICVPKNMLRGCLPPSGNFCVGKPNGAYPMCSCCTDYILCWQGMSKTMRCGMNEVFQQYPYGSCVPRNENLCPRSAPL
ncbi:unnamed protein product [Soboliphyme baturini]|uniref:Chitin-binding type-2 domain-containing protein n=1 Tax=Soboliphyme baturini TaxID=241478 RepID=A0A183INI8_9BILA|nr:unnamed protein product [Soboliphyme baturini]